jgi:chaperonin GroES
MLTMLAFCSKIKNKSILSFFKKEIMMNLKPLFDRVVVRRVDSESVTKGGIFIPDAATEKADQGTVLAVGAGKRNNQGEVVALDVGVNDRVLFGKFAGQTVKIDGEELLILKEEDILAVINQGE